MVIFLQKNIAIIIIITIIIIILIIIIIIAMICIIPITIIISVIGIVFTVTISSQAIAQTSDLLKTNKWKTVEVTKVIELDTLNQ